MNKNVGLLICRAKRHIAIARDFGSGDPEKRDFHLMRADIYLDAARSGLSGKVIITSTQKDPEQTGLEWLGI